MARRRWHGLPVVLCYLEGKTYNEAAQLLGWAEGTVSGRLARARELLRGQLARHGLAPSSVLLTALPSRSTEAAPVMLTETVLRAAAAFSRGQPVPEGLISTTAIALANEVMRSMILRKGKIALLLLVLGVAGTSAAVFAPRPQPEKEPQAAPLPPRPPAVPKVKTTERPPLKKEWQGKWDADPFTGTANEKVGVAPLGGDLVQVEGIGQIWLDRQWRYRFPIHASQHEMELRQRRQLETLRLVSDDLPAFLKQVVNVVVEYREGNDELLQWLSADSSRPILEAMEIDKVEKLDWTKQRWQTEMVKLQKRGAGTLELTPGLGFSLPLLFSGEKEMLIPMYGRVHLKNDIRAKVRQAVESDPDKAKTLRLLPNGPEE